MNCKHKSSLDMEGGIFIKRFFFLLLCIALLLNSCQANPVSVPNEPDLSSAAVSTENGEGTGTQVWEESKTVVETTPYIDQVVHQTIEKITMPDMSEYEKAKAAFDYLIETTYYEDPIGMDVWRIRDKTENPTYTFLENRALSVLLYGKGYCMDYASALVLLLRGMGMEAVYVPGLTYSAEGAYVDHAWTIAKIDGVWYHLDSQLQDEISRNHSISYLYFMKSDATMRASHRWGQNLIDSGLLTEEQNAEIAKGYLAPECPRDYPTPKRREYTPVPSQDSEEILSQLEQERRQYEQEHGPLAPLELDLTVPVFGFGSFGPPD
ncbi:MAG TPA: transglutaminase-like domain-containing protein [Firmicutes bacterium]|nr:transglutaminase-like domain-containing protein [Bacillota bacterium]